MTLRNEEEQIAALFSNALDRKAVDTSAAISDLWVNSLVLAEICMQVEKTFGLRGAAQLLMKEPTITAMAARVRELRR